MATFPARRTRAKPTASSTSVATVHASRQAGRVLVDAPGSCPRPTAEKTASRASSCRKCRPGSRSLVGDAQRRRRRVSVAAMPYRAPSSANRAHASRLLAQWLTGDNRPGRQPHRRAKIAGKYTSDPHRRARRGRARRRHDTRTCTPGVAPSRALDVNGIEGACSNATSTRSPRVRARAGITVSRETPTPPTLPCPTNSSCRMRRRYTLRARTVPRHRARATAAAWLDLVNSSAPLLVDQTVMARSCARASFPARARRRRGRRPGGWAATAKILVDAYEAACQRSSHRRHPRILRARGAGTSPTSRKCWRARIANPTWWAGAGDDHHRRHRPMSLNASAPRRQRLESWGCHIQNPCSHSASTPPRWRACVRLATLISETDDVIHICPICSSLRRPRRHTHGAAIRCSAGSVVKEL